MWASGCYFSKRLWLDGMWVAYVWKCRYTPRNIFEQKYSQKGHFCSSSVVQYRQKMLQQALHPILLWFRALGLIQEARGTNESSNSWWHFALDECMEWTTILIWGSCSCYILLLLQARANHFQSEQNYQVIFATLANCQEIQGKSTDTDRKQTKAIGFIHVSGKHFKTSQCWFHHQCTEASKKRWS